MAKDNGLRCSYMVQAQEKSTNCNGYADFCQSQKENSDAPIHARLVGVSKIMSQGAEVSFPSLTMEIGGVHSCNLTWAQYL